MTRIERIKDVQAIIRNRVLGGRTLLAAKEIDDYYREKYLQIIVEDATQKEEEK